MTKSGAIISEDGVHRYRLWRSWNDGPRVCFVMLNPSTADTTANDPTIMKCMGFAHRWGYAGIEVVNLYSFRATDPRAVAASKTRRGPEFERHCVDATKNSEKIVLAWGANPIVDLFATRWVLKQTCDLWCLGKTMAGQPRHPLYVPYAKELELYRQSKEITP